MAPNIQRLPENVINQVCAGEVIERPSAVVKELVENSLDAGATHVAVTFRRAGKDLISVADDGAAMDPEDAILCLKRHATSKIRRAEDLSRISTFGFRGEAIPTIASVSKFTLRTRRGGDELGTEIVVDGGNVRKAGRCVCPNGTQIEVAQLFRSVPARRKFLKSDQTEANHIINAVRLFALDFPKIRFSVRHGDRTVWDVAAEASAEGRIERFWGSEIWTSLGAVDFAENDRHVHGWVLDPKRRSSSGDMVFFVNHRVIVSRDLKNWVMGAYAKYLPYAQSVPCFLFLDLPLDQVDVNVHPAKREVRFSNGADLKAFISKAIEGVLGLDNSRPISKIATLRTGVDFTRISPVIRANEGVPKCGQRIAQSVVPPEQRQEEGPKVVPGDLARLPECEGTPPGGKISPLGSELPPTNQRKFTRSSAPVIGLHPKIPAPLLSGSCEIIKWKFLGKMDERCVLFSTETGLIFFDVFRAAQRIAYERILAEQGEADGQRLLIPLTLDFRRQSTEVTEEMVGELAQIGFGLQKKADMLYEIATLPSWIRECSGEVFLYDWLVLKRANLHGMQTEFLAKTAAGYVASSKKWQTEQEIMQLVSDLMACEMAVLALDGSRIYFEIPRSEVKRRWKRA
jgi:DNA mismatch repair protein MutL